MAIVLATYSLVFTPGGAIGPVLPHRRIPGALSSRRAPPPLAQYYDGGSGGYDGGGGGQYEGSGGYYNANSGAQYYDSYGGGGGGGGLGSLSVGELKALLTERGIDFRDCLEKRDLVERLENSQVLHAASADSPLRPPNLHFAPRR
jgi:hypothetical protein